jgi:hypothetical protein
MNSNNTSRRGAAATDKPLDLAESVAGEEDPGASVDVAMAANAPGRSDQPAGRRGNEPVGAQPPMSPGDEAPPGTPGTGEDVCPRCGGSGKLAGGDCPVCQGTGKVTVGIGGA